jgi:hypothetical protein
MYRFLRRAVVPGVLALAVAGCFGSTDSTGKLVCPTPVIAPDLDAAATLRDGGSGPTDIRYGIKFMTVKTNCRTEKIGLTAETRVTFVAARSDQTVSHGEFAYFVAVADAQRNILNKKQYTVSFDFVPRQKQLQISDQFAVGLPLHDLSDGGKYVIIVGLQLSPEQLDFNRKQQQTQ